MWGSGGAPQHTLGPPEGNAAWEGLSTMANPTLCPPRTDKALDQL